MLVQHNVVSSHIHSIAYDEDTRDLYIGFHTTKNVYLYKDVKPSLVKRFLKAESLGKFLWAYIRGQYNEYVVDSIF